MSQIPNLPYKRPRTNSLGSVGTQNDEGEQIVSMRVSKPPQKPVVLNYFFVDELEKKGGGIPRMTCVAYLHDRRNSSVYYAGAIFRQDKPKEMVEQFGSKKALKKALSETAMERLIKKPNKTCVRIGIWSKELQIYLRRNLYRHGVANKGINQEILEKYPQFFQNKQNQSRMAKN